MRRATNNFWLFFVVSTLSGGILGRYLAALLKGYVTPGIVVTALLALIVTAFSVTLLLRILRALTVAGRRSSEARRPRPTLAEPVLARARAESHAEARGSGRR